MESSFDKLSKGVHSIINRFGNGGGKALLFGSRARGDARSDSDWDLLILLDKQKIVQDDLDSVSYPIRELGWEIGEQVNPILFTTGEWLGKASTPFYKNVMAEGIEL